VNDRAVELLEQYEIEVLRIRKGRGAFLCDTDRGCLIFKEYTGPENRLQLQDKLLKHIEEAGTVRAEALIPNREGGLFVKDTDETKYVLKTWCEGRECDIYNREECARAVELLAKLHDSMQLQCSVEELPTAFSPEKEYEKHNRELKKVRKFLNQKSQKTWFEINLAKHFDFFLNQALTVTEEWKYYSGLEQNHGSDVQTDAGDAGVAVNFCHGDYQYHNILRDNKGWFLVNFEKCMADDPIRDLYLLMRKLLEKGDWSVELGSELIGTYEKFRPISALSRIDLYYRLSYPEKFWKIANFYYNSGKAWIPGRNLEKLEKLVEQEKAKQTFLDTLFRNVTP